MSLKGKTAVITDATKGIGRAIDEELVAHGVNIVIVVIDVERGSKTSLELRNKKVNIKTYIRDLENVYEFEDLYTSINVGSD